MAPTRAEPMLSKPAQRYEYSLAFRNQLRSFAEDYASAPAQVLYLQGEFHDVITHGAVYFTSLSKIESFTKIILNDFKSERRIQDFANVIAKRMRDKCGGRRTYFPSGLHQRKTS